MNFFVWLFWEWGGAIERFRAEGLCNLPALKKYISVVDSIRSGSQTESFARSDKGEFNPTVEEKEDRG